jgi:hypothetical protein
MAVRLSRSDKKASGLLLEVQGAAGDSEVLLEVQELLTQIVVIPNEKCKWFIVTNVAWRPCRRFVPVRVERPGKLIDESAHSERE